MSRDAAAQDPGLQVQAYVLLSLTALLWASNIIVARYVAGHVPPVALASIRWLIGTLILLPFALPHLRADWPELRRSWRRLVFLSFVGITVYNTLVYIGLQYTVAINGLLMQSAQPLLIALWSFLLFADRLVARQVLGILASLAGVLIIISRGDLSSLLSVRFNFGDVLIMIGVAEWALYTAALRLRPAVHWTTFIVATFLIGNLLLTPALALEIASGFVPQLDRTTILACLYIAIVPSALAYALYNRGVAIIGANRAGPFLHLMPLFGTVLAVFFLGERLHLYHIAAFALIVCGIALATRRTRR